MASVQERVTAKGVAYRVLYRLEGKQTSDTFKTDAEAQKHKRRVAQFGPAYARQWAKDQHRTVAADHHTLATFTAEHIVGADRVTEGTRAEYTRLAARTFLPVIGEKPIESVSRTDVLAWLAVQAKTPTRSGKPTSAKTIANAHGLLSVILKAAVVAGLRTDNPAYGMRLPQGDREEMTVLNDNEIVELLAHIDPHYRLFAAFLYGTGLRFGEATALQWGDLDLDAVPATARVVRAWKKGAGAAPDLGAPKTARGKRTVPIPLVLVGPLRELRGEPGTLVFVNRVGGRIANATFHQNTWQPAVRAFAGDVVETAPVSIDGKRQRLKVLHLGPGKHPRVHDLRHSYATNQLASRQQPFELSRFMGHQQMSTTTDIYGHLDQGALERFAATASLSLSQAYPQIEG